MQNACDSPADEEIPRAVEGVEGADRVTPLGPFQILCSRRAEICNGKDDNCNDEVDEGFDIDGDGTTSCGGDCDDSDPFVFPGASEECDGKDNDCNGEVDEGFDDLDLDGYTTCNSDCDDSNGDIHPGAEEICNSLDDDCDGLIDNSVTAPDEDGDGYTTCDNDCNDLDPTIHPSAPEDCNIIDDDCDGIIDESLDDDGDGYTTCGGDCDDSDRTIHPGEVETCDEVDEDCDGRIDEGLYQDHDNDGYGSAPLSTCGDSPHHANNNSDCDDSDATVHPGAEEQCDEVDHNCDGDPLSGAGAGSVYVDIDGDGHGDPEVSFESCDVPAGTSALGDDCDDLNPLVYPGAEELCDDLDNDCNGLAEYGKAPKWREDADGDGFGSEETFACSPVEGWTQARGDCDDLDDGVHPGAYDELGDSIDSDCGGGDGPDPHLGFSETSRETISDAINSLEDGHILWVGPGVYEVPQPLILDTLTASIFGTHGAAETHIIATDNSSILESRAANVTLQDLSLSQGVGLNGGAISASSKSIIQLDRVIAKGNTSTNHGGALYANQSTLLLNSVTFEDNEAVEQGGALYISTGTVLVGGALFFNNSADGGGAATLSSSKWKIDDSSFEGNEARGIGGALNLSTGYYSSSTSRTIKESIFRNNSAGGHGGAVFHFQEGSHFVRFEDAIFDGNFSGREGGAIQSAQGSMSFLRSVFVGNRALEEGGAIHHEDLGSLTIKQSAFLENMGDLGGGIYLERNHEADLRNNIFVSNYPSHIHSKDEYDVNSHYNLFTGSETPVIPENYDENSIYGEPRFRRYTANRRYDDDLRLHPDSPARDSGDPTIIDIDGTVSDMGIYGGLNGDAFAYMDEDGDGLYDNWEQEHGLFSDPDAAQSDPDNDGLSNLAEMHLGTDPHASDTDSDAQSDGAELEGGSNPLDPYSQAGVEGIATLNVPGDRESLQAALYDLHDAGSIHLGAGTHSGVLSLSNQTLVLSGSMTETMLGQDSLPIVSRYGSSLTVRDFNLSNQEAVGVALIDSLESYLTLDNVVVENTLSELGSPLRVDRGGCTIEGSRFLGNQGATAGVIYTRFADVQIIDSVFSNNHSVEASPITSNGGDMMISGSLFSSNSGSLGGAMGVSRLGLHVLDSTFFDNEATSLEGEPDNGQGGAIGASLSYVDLSGVDFFDNVAVNGGALAGYAASFAVTSSSCENNIATASGGCVYLLYSSSVRGDLFVADNYATSHGGGIYASESDIQGVRVETNRAGGSGGGIWQDVVNTSNAWLDSNEANRGGGIFALGSGSISESVIVDNDSFSGGGGVFLTESTIDNDGSLTMDSTFLGGNWTGDIGGGIFSDNKSAHLNNVAIIGNDARAGAGAYVYDGIFNLSQSVVASNASSGAGGGILFDTASSQINSSIVSENNGSSGTESLFARDSDILIENSTVFRVGDLGVRNIPLDSGSISFEDPLFISAPTEEGWQSADLHLRLSSPAVDEGDPSTFDVDLSASDQGIFGGALGGSWDKDQDGLPDYPWAGDYSDVPGTLDSSQWDDNDWY